MSYSWLKLYVDILDDPKMGRMSDYLFRSTILFFLVACKNGGSGELPDRDSLAWLLRKEVKEIDDVIGCLIECGIVIQREGKCIVKNYVKRQSPMNFNERQIKHRNGMPKISHENVTLTDSDSDSNTDVESDTDVETEIEPDSDSYKQKEECVLKFISAYKFPVNRRTKTYIKTWLKDFPDEKVIMRALEDGYNRGAVSLAYIDKIIVNWKVNGLPVTHEEKIILGQKRALDKFEMGLKSAIEEGTPFPAFPQIQERDLTPIPAFPQIQERDLEEGAEGGNDDNDR